MSLVIADFFVADDAVELFGKALADVAETNNIGWLVPHVFTNKFFRPIHLAGFLEEG